MRGALAGVAAAVALITAGCTLTQAGTTSATGGCDQSYKGACLNPNAADYDCQGGSGDGPEYVEGPVTVVDADHFGLDADGDGTGRE